MSGTQSHTNILFLCDSFLPHAGGARVYYYNLYKWLSRAFGDQITVVTKKVPGWQEFDSCESMLGFEIIRRSKPLETWKIHELPKIVFTAAEAFRVLSTRRIDMVHFGDLYPPGMVSLWMNKIFGLPYLAYVHGDELAQIEQRRYQPAVCKRILGAASVVVAANSFAREKALAGGVSPEKVHTITPGVDMERFLPQPRDPQLVERFNLDRKVVLLSASRLVPKKGHETVLRAFASILPQHPEARYVIVGDGPERGRLEALVTELKLNHAVIFVGDVPNEHLASFYNLCDIFVMANRRAPSGDIETFGMVFIEANAAGKPVVGGRSGGAIEAIEHGHTGFLVDPDDIQELAQTLSLLVSNGELRERLGQAGLRRVRQQFDWNSRAEYLHALSLDILGRARCGGGRA